jgi:hypothetical protein
VVAALSAADAIASAGRQQVPETFNATERS